MPEPLQPETPHARFSKGSKKLLEELVGTEVYATVEKKYLISQGSLEAMISGYTSIFSVIFGFFGGVAGVLWGFWSQCTIEPTKRYYLDFAVISTVLAVLCFVICIHGWWKAFEAKRQLYRDAKRIS